MANGNADRHIWEFAWVRDLVLLGMFLLAAWTAMEAAEVTIPLAIGLAVAYATQPMVRWLDRRLRIPRWASALLMMFLLVGGFVAALLYVLPDLYAQASLFIHNFPKYFDKLASPSGMRWQDLRLSLAEPAATKGAPVASSGVAGLQNAGEMVAQWAVFGFGIISSLVGTTVGVVISVLVWGISFVTFTMRFEALTAWFEGFIPPERRERILRIVERMDKSVAGNLRGRMIQSAVLALELCIGWKIIGVRYWLLLGIVVGLMNLVPYISLIGSPLVVALNWADKESTGADVTFWATFALPVLVHIAGQFIDGWVIEPLVQSRATNLSGITVLVSVMVGGTLFGLFGMVAAVPLAACLKILGEEVAVPWFRDWLRDAAGH